MSNQKLTVNDEVYFIRHKVTDEVDRKMILEVMRQKRIAIMFKNDPWIAVFDASAEKPSAKYFEHFTKKNSTYRSALNYFHKISSEGGYIVAEYLDGEMPGNGYGAIVSRVLKGTQVESAAGFEVTLQLDASFYEIIDYSKYPVLLAIRPPYSTLCKPSRNTYKEFINFKLADVVDFAEVSLDLLHPKMAEQMCVEYLRSVGVNGNKLSYCTLKPGKTLAVIDICGVLYNDRDVFAQVKNGEIEKSDLEAFAKFTQNNIEGVNIVFSKDTDKAEPNIVFINIDDVFNHFKANNRNMLVKMTF
jgi:hypothetical protein